MCDLSIPSVSLFNTFEQQSASCWTSCAAKTGNSCLVPGGEAVQVDENYLDMRWSHTAKVLREFTQRKAAEAEEIRRRRGNLQVLSAEERSAALACPASPQPNPLDQGGKNLWPDAVSEQAALSDGAAARLRQAPTRGHGGGGASTSSLDVLLQSVLQRSTAVSTKLTQTYLHSLDKETGHAPNAAPELSRSVTRKAISPVRGDRSRNQSRIQRQNTTTAQLQQQQQQHEEERPPPSSSTSPSRARTKPSPPPPPPLPPPPPPQQQGRQGANNTAVSPLSSRPSSPNTRGPLDSEQGSLPQLPPAVSALGLQEEALTAGEGPHPRVGSPQPAPDDAARQQPQQQQQSAAATGDPFGRRTLSRSLDGLSSESRYRRFDGPHRSAQGAGEDAADDGTRSPLDASRAQPIRGASGSGVHLPHIPNSQPGATRSVGGCPGDEGRGVGCAGGRTTEASGSGSSHSSSGEAFIRVGGASSGRRPAAAVAAATMSSFRLSDRRNQCSMRRSGSMSYHGFASPSAQSPWAKSTTARELVFTQF